MFDDLDELEPLDVSDDLPDEVGLLLDDGRVIGRHALFNGGDSELDPFWSEHYASLAEEYQNDLDFEAGAEWF